MNEQQFRELSAARALHALSPEEEQEFSEAQAAHPEWQPIVDEDRETAARLGAASAEAAPPRGAREAILDLISRTPQFEAPEHRLPGAQSAFGGAAAGGAAAGAGGGAAAPGDPRGDAAVPAGDSGSVGSAEELFPELAEDPDDAEHPEQAFRRSRRKAAWFGLAASVAVLLAVALALPVRGMIAPQDPVSVALQQVESASDARTASVNVAGSGEATLHWSDSTGQAVFVTEGMAAAPDNHDYELWIVRGDQPISLGVMHADADGGAAVLADGFQAGDALAVTVENRGGSPSGAPTTDPIVVVGSA